MKNVSYVTRISLTTLIVSSLFVQSASAQTSSNSLLSLIKGNSGGIISAVISCNRANINKGLDSLKSSASGAIEAVSVADRGVSQTSADTASQTKALQQKSTCKNAIEKAAAQAILKELTLRTVDWINHGFQNGDAIFSVDTSSFLKDLRNDQINQFSSVIGFDPTKYPFGKTVAKQLLTSSRDYFERDMQYNLSKVVASSYPGRTGVDFQRNFAIGGWNAFLAQSLPQNNPYGFQMSAQDELAARIADTGYSKAQDIKDQLQRNMGFLDLKKCVDPKGWNQKSFDAQMSGEDDPARQQEIIAKYGCKRFETQTPGGIAAEQLSTVIGSPFRQLEIGQDLTASLTAVFDALTTQMLNKGLQSLESDDNYRPNNYSNNLSYNYASKFIDNGDDTGGSGGDGWWNDPNLFDIFDLRSSKDGGKGVVMLIEREEAYKNILDQEIAVVQNQLIPSIYQLDMCIPGPNPNWKNVAQDNIDNFLDKVPTSADTILSKGVQIAQKIQMGGMVKDIIKGASEDSRNEHLYSEVVGRTLGVKANRDEKLNGYENIPNIFYNLIKRYDESITATYGKNLEYLPPYATQPARDLYRELGAFNQSITDNEDLVGQTQSMLSQLNRLRQLIAELPDKSDPDYASYLDVVNRTFKRLAPDIITDDDLLSANDQLKDYTDTYNDIVKVPNGYLDFCLKETSDPSYKNPTTRMQYPAYLFGEKVDPRVDKLPTKDTFLEGARYDMVGLSVTKPELKSKLINVSDLFTLMDQCQTYYDPGTVSYSTNFWGAPKAKSGDGYAQKDSCIAGLESLMGVY